MVLDFRNINTLWSSILVETLYRSGLKIAVICPGSRSTPLTLAFAGHRGIEAIPILDERSAAFFALGLAKRHHEPIALVCTSGSAAANFYPAIIEARESRVPLLILTADRPPELRHCHAGQTIDQLKIYSHYPNWQAELSVPHPNNLTYLRQIVRQATERCLYPTPGPVHLNIPFAEPLAPLPELKTPVEANFDENIFFANLYPPDRPRLFLEPDNLDFPPKGIIIVGVDRVPEPEEYCRSIARLSLSLGYPVLADALSPLRNHASLNPYLITTYDLLLRHPVPELSPDLAIGIGELPTSKELRTWLERVDPPRLIISPDPDNLDAIQGRTRHIRADIRDFTAKLPDLNRGNSPYLQLWLEKEKIVRERLDRVLEKETRFIEGKTARVLWDNLPPETPIFIANSMPIRYAEFFAPPNDRRLIPYFSRGANGIDGTLSTAIGIAYKNTPSLLLTGDLALLHDTNGFLIGKSFQGSLTIVLINNNGGGIFEMLPIAKFRDTFEEFFATPQNIDFSRLCTTYGVDYHPIGSWEELAIMVKELPERGIRLLEVRCDRSFNAEWLKENLKEMGKIDY